MEKEKLEKIKEGFLAAYVLVCVGLIFTLWGTALFKKEVETPYFYRGAPELSASYSVTQTAIAEQVLLGTGTPTVEPKHRNATATPTPTPTPVPIINFTPESDG